VLQGRLLYFINALGSESWKKNGQLKYADVQKVWKLYLTNYIFVFSAFIFYCTYFVANWDGGGCGRAGRVEGLCGEWLCCGANSWRSFAWEIETQAQSAYAAKLAYTYTEWSRKRRKVYGTIILQLTSDTYFLHISNFFLKILLKTAWLCDVRSQNYGAVNFVPFCGPLCSTWYISHFILRSHSRTRISYFLIFRRCSLQLSYLVVINLTWEATKRLGEIRRTRWLTKCVKIAGFVIHKRIPIENKIQPFLKKLSTSVHNLLINPAYRLMDRQANGRPCDITCFSSRLKSVFKHGF